MDNWWLDPSAEELPPYFLSLFILSNGQPLPASGAPPTVSLQALTIAARLAFGDDTLDTDDVEGMCASLLEQVRLCQPCQFSHPTQDLTRRSYLSGLPQSVRHARSTIGRVAKIASGWIPACLYCTSRRTRLAYRHHLRFCPSG